MGLADYGATNTSTKLVPYSYNTSSFEATVTVNSVTPFDVLTGPVNYDLQLNTVLKNVTLGNSVLNATTTGKHPGFQGPDAFWTQNVPDYDFATHSLLFVDNIWNFSDPAASLQSGTNTLQGQGVVTAGGYYYDYYPTVGGSLASGTGVPTPILITPPYTLQLFNNASTAPASWSPYGAISTNTSFGFQLTTPANNPFEYPLSNGTYVTTNDLFVTYDKITFNSTSTASSIPTPGYMVTGHSLTPTGYIPYDAEIMIGGGGGGCDITIWNINATMQLQYMSGTTYQNIKSAWDVGSETGETSEGVSEWWTTPGVVNLGPGPSIIYPLWGAYGTTTTAGDWKVPMTLKPSNAFVFLQVGPTYNSVYSAWAPTPWSGNTITYNLAPLGYVGSVMLSNYDPVTFAITAAGPQAITLTADASQGVYTPLYAFNNAQLANISTSGAGTSANPYLLDTQASGLSINDSFQEFNDYLFPVFPGILLAGTTAYVDFNNSYAGTGSFLINYQDPVATLLEMYYYLPGSNYLPIYTYDASHVSILESQISGWFYAAPGGFGFAVASVLMWNTTDSLVANNYFADMGWSLEAYNNPGVIANNYFWGNVFATDTTYLGSVFNSPLDVGLELGESGDTVYNNYFDTAVPAINGNYDIWSGAKVSYLNAWNVMYTPCTMVTVAGVTSCVTPVTWINGYPLTSNIIGEMFIMVDWVGGNYWSNFPCNAAGALGSVPYTDYGLILSGGDYLPLCGYGTPVVFMETGLPATALSWTVTFNGATESVAQDYAVFEVAAGGAYNYNVAMSGGYTPTPMSGSIAVMGEVTQDISFAAGQVPSVTIVYPTSGYVFTGITNFTVSWTVTGIPASEYQYLQAVVTMYSKYDSSASPWAYFTGTNTSALTTGINSIQITRAGLSLPSAAKTMGDLPYAPYILEVTVYNLNYTAFGGNTIAQSPVPTTIYRAYADISSPTTGAQLYAGIPFAISSSFDWASWYSATNATLVITNTNTSLVVDQLTVKLGEGATGTWTASVALPVGNYMISVSFATFGAHPYYVNATSVTVSVAGTITPIVYVNATMTQYKNITLGPIQIVGAILIVVGLAVGFLIGYMLMRSTKQKVPPAKAWDSSPPPATPPAGNP
jgi:thermopsin